MRSLEKSIGLLQTFPTILLPGETGGLTDMECSEALAMLRYPNPSATLS